MKKTFLFRITALIMLFVLLTGLAGCSGGGTEASKATEAPAAGQEPEVQERSAEEIAFQQDVYALIENIVPESITGDKAACIIIPEIAWESYVSLEAAPEELRTADASQVRYIIRRYEYKEIVGHYTSGSSISGAAYQWRYVIEVEDLKLNGILAEAEFLGSEPPKTLEPGESPEGGLPDEGEINAWIAETIANGFVDRYPLYVSVPEGWGAPFIRYRYYKALAVKEKIKQLIPEGDWYCIMLPSGASNITITTHPNTAGSESYHETYTEDIRTYQKPGWIIVYDLEGSAEYFGTEPAEGSGQTE